MVKKSIKYIFMIGFFLISCYAIYTSEENSNTIKNFVIKEPIEKVEKIITQNLSYSKKEESIGKIIIDKINLEKELYDMYSTENDVEKNVTILDGSIEPENENSIMFIAAHSGTGRLAFFNKLDTLNNGDQVKLIYKNKEYNYIINEIYEVQKDGDIEITKDNKRQLILTTCSQKDKEKQLIINCTEKES